MAVDLDNFELAKERVGLEEVSRRPVQLGLQPGCALPTKKTALLTSEFKSAALFRP